MKRISAAPEEADVVGSERHVGQHVAPTRSQADVQEPPALP
jgi:hypothetical protein